MGDAFKRVDVVIVGGGIVGCAVALAARHEGLTAAVLERGRICGEASSVAAGLICAQYDADRDSPLLRLRLAGRDAFPEFAQMLEDLAGASVGYVGGQTMSVAWTEDRCEMLRDRVARQRAAGLDAEFIEAEEALHREPYLTPELLGAALFPDGQVDAQRWPPIVHRALLASGVDVHEGTEVTSLAHHGLHRIHTVRGTIATDQVVLATGSWARELAPWVPVVPSKGHVIMLDAPNIRATCNINTPGGTLAQRADGRVVFGATKERVGFDRRIRAGAIQSLLTSVTTAIPSLAGRPLTGMLTGFRPEPVDGQPIIGRDPRSGVFLATGHYTHGVTMSWVTGQIVARLLVGKAPGYPIASFAPDRICCSP